MGYFGRVSQISRGPWFAEVQVEDDNLEYYYMHSDAAGNVRYLLSNNMAIEDRIEFSNMWKAHNRVNSMAWFGGLFVSTMAISKAAYFKGMAPGWKLLSWFAIAGVSKMAVNNYYGRTYGPLLGAYLRKYQNNSAVDAWEIRDRKREYYMIDDSSYMNYDEGDMKDMHMHANHGPQPDGEALDASWLTELNSFLDGKENHLKDHPRFLNYAYTFKDKSYPTLDQAKDLIEGGKQ